MQSRNGDPSGDKPWTRVHHWHHPVFSASQRVPGKETAGRGGSFALQFLSSSSFPWTRLHNSRILMSYVLGRRRSTSLFPSSVWYLTGSLCCVILMSTHQSELFWLRFSYFGVTCLHVVKRTPAPWLWWRVPGGLFFLLGSTSAEEPWNIPRDGCFLYLCPHVHLSWCFLIFFLLQRKSAAPSLSLEAVLCRPLRRCTRDPVVGQLQCCSLRVETVLSFTLGQKVSLDFCTKTCEDWLRYVDLAPLQSGLLKEQKS